MSGHRYMLDPEREYRSYRVCGQREYRGHAHGEVFMARLDANAEARAVERGDLEVLGVVVPSLQPGSYRLPKGWETPTT